MLKVGVWMGWPQKVLMVAYYFPPLGMGGVQRAAKFVKYLPRYGWKPVVLTVKPIQYYAYDASLMEDVRSAPIFRTESLDPNRVAFLLRGSQESTAKAPRTFRKGKFWTVMRYGLVPDNKILWVPFALTKGAELIRREGVSAVLTTSPPHSAHLLGILLQRLFGLRWVADFRDYWTNGDVPYELTPWHKALHRSLERRVLQKADAVTCISDPIAQTLRSHAPDRESSIHVLPNGFDPEDFRDAQPKTFDRITIVHNGSLTHFRDPSGFFQPLQEVLEEFPKWKDTLQVLFVGQIFDLSLRALPPLVAEITQFVGYQSHRESLFYLLGADLLLFLISSDCPPGIMTGKVFEYLAAGKPVLAISPPVAGLEVLRKHTQVYEAAPDNPSQIKSALVSALREVTQRSKREKVEAPWRREELKVFQRPYLAGQLAAILDQLMASRT